MNKHSLLPNLVESQNHVLEDKLRHHPLYEAIQSLENLRVFMQHHVYAVWDFMSLIKALQQHLAPTKIPWAPPKNIRYANFINTLVLEEESDHALTQTMDSTHASHFQTYLLAMDEVGADIQSILDFVECVSNEGLESALCMPNIPAPAKKFMRFTFAVIKRDQPHLLAAALAYGRETLVPQLYRAIKQQLKTNSTHAPSLQTYLQRHIQLDEQEHGPLALQMVEELCEGSAKKQTEALQVAEQALTVRLEFWNGIYKVLQTNLYAESFAAA